MGTREIVVSVSQGGSVRARRDNLQSPTGKLRFEGLDADLIRVFERWLRERDRRWRTDEIQVFGSLLHRTLLAGDVWAWIERSLVGMPSDDRVRLQLAFPTTAGNRLSAVPWEYLYAPASPPRGSGYFLATDTRFILTRYIPLGGAQKRLAPETAVRLLLVVSQPRDLPDVVAGPVVQAVTRLAPMLRADVRILEEPNVHVLLRELERFQPHILHFVGHGEYDEKLEQGRVALVEVDGSARWVTDSGLSELLRQAHAVPRVVLLHACEGAKVDDQASFAGIAPQLVLHGVQCVVAMQYAVTNTTAIAFTKAFYEDLAVGSQVDEAVQKGRWTIAGALSADENARLLGLPVIYLHSRDSVLVPPRPAGEERAGSGARP